LLGGILGHEFRPFSEVRLPLVLRSLAPCRECFGLVGVELGSAYSVHPHEVLDDGLQVEVPLGRQHLGPTEVHEMVAHRADRTKPGQPLNKAVLVVFSYLVAV